MSVNFLLINLCGRSLRSGLLDPLSSGLIGFVGRGFNEVCFQLEISISPLGEGGVFYG